MKQWSNLSFVLKKRDGSQLELGGEKYPIMKSSELFDSITTFGNFNEARNIPIEVYISSLTDMHDFINFFESTKVSEGNYIYDLDTFCNGKKYDTQCCTNDKPYELKNIDSLYGTDTNPSASVKISIIMNDPHFYSKAPVKDKHIGSGTSPKISFPFKPKKKQLPISISQPLVSHLINNGGNEDNGIILEIITGGMLKNPKIINRTTGFEMGFNLTTLLNDSIVIDTRKKEVHVNGELQLNKKKLFDKWLLLIKGNNIIEFGADVGGDLCIVKIQFHEKHRAIG